jgi:hypothetical protein
MAYWHHHVPMREEAAVHIPENIRIPVIVLALQAALLIGTSMVFLVLRP